jgi:hypothetical protein
LTGGLEGFAAGFAGVTGGLITPGLTANLLPSVTVLEELASDVLLEPVGVNLGAVIWAFL